MADDQVKQNLLALDQDGLKAFFADMGEKAFRATQILKWIYQRGVIDFEQMTDLSKALRTRLQEVAEIRPPEVVLDQASDDGTHKWLLRLSDGNCIETVYIPDSGRGTLCVSSQVGCVLNCSFCSTAKQGFNRNLTVDEIIGQVWLAAKLLGQFEAADGSSRKVTNVVMMGMGEPLLNLDNVVPAMKLMMEDNGFSISRRRLTLSTAGVVPQLDELNERCNVALAVSLHATNDELRNELVPVNRKYPISELMAACKRYLDKMPREKITFEYVMIDGVNDSIKDAKALIRLLEGVPAKVNLIPFNPYPGSPYRRSSDAALEAFQTKLMSAGYITMMRKTRGDDIDAACGQLAGRVQDKTRRSIKFRQQLSGGQG